MRGCFGGCTFCSITAHQGRIIQSRSKESVLGELARMGRGRRLLGGRLRHRRADGQHVPDALHPPRGRGSKCKRLSCVHPKVCKLLGTDHGPLVELMRESREVPGVRKVFVASGIRMDLAQRSP